MVGPMTGRTMVDKRIQVMPSSTVRGSELKMRIIQAGQLCIISQPMVIKMKDAAIALMTASLILSCFRAP